MKLSKLTSLFLVLIAITVFPPAASTATTGPYRAIVVFDTGIKASVRDGLIKEAGAVKVKDLKLINAAAVLLPEKGAARTMSKKSGVKRIDEDIIVTAIGRGGLGSVSQRPQVLPWGVNRIDADLVWAPPTGATGAGVKVAVIDTGIQLDHPDLAVNIKGGYNAINPAKSATDDNGHGTHVAGTIAAAANTVGVIGVGPNVSLYAVKVLNASGSGWLSDVIEGIQWAANPENGIKVINMSLGSSYYSASEHDAIIQAYNAGITIVAAAGNNYGGAVGYPAAYDEVIAVSAATKSDSLAGFSSVGPQVDLAAPGESIYSTYKSGKYATLSGTSMASPHVAGSAALVIGARGALTPAQVKAALQITADQLPGLTANQQGAGLVDAEEAVTTTTVIP